MQERLIPLPSALRRIAEDINHNYLPVSLTESKNQARENLYAISIADEQRLKIEFTDLEKFIESIKSAVAKKIKENSTIYFWLDPLANELRFSIISSNKPADSFKTKIKIVNIEKIIYGYLKKDIESGLDEEDGLWVFHFNVRPN